MTEDAEKTAFIPCWYWLIVLINGITFEVKIKQKISVQKKWRNKSRSLIATVSLNVAFVKQRQVNPIELYHQVS